MNSVTKKKNIDKKNLHRIEMTAYLRNKALNQSKFSFFLDQILFYFIYCDCLFKIEKKNKNQILCI